MSYHIEKKSFISLSNRIQQPPAVKNNENVGPGEAPDHSPRWRFAPAEPTRKW